jgi:CheY-like chemotaxis protein
VAVIDIVLPDGDGWQLAQRIRAVRPIPLVAVTAHAEYVDLERAKAVGIDHLLTKPVSTRTVRDVVRTSIQRDRSEQSAGT